MDKTRFIRPWAAILLLAVHAGPALPEWRPSGNVEIIATAAPGGGNDAAAQLIQQLLQQERIVASSAVVLKRGGTETINYVNQHAGDGHYLVLTTPVLLTDHIVSAGAPAYTDITPVATLISEYILVAVRADSPLVTGGDLVRRLRENTSSVSFGFGSSIGNPTHLAAALIARTAGGDLRRLRVTIFNTGARVVDALAKGEIDAMLATAAPTLIQARAGNLRLLGMTAPRRLGGPLASVPTWKEQGADVVLSSWRGIAGPRGMTPEQVAFWERAFLKLAFSGEWLDELQKRSWDSTYLNSGETRDFLEAQSAVMRGLLTDLGLVK